LEVTTFYNSFPKYDLAPAQLKDDITMMYGALKSVFSNGKVKKHLNRNKKEHNGIAAWISMLTEYDHDGDTGVLIDKYDYMINTKFHRNYTAGITGFIDEDETAITELTYLGKGHSEHYKMKVLMRNLHLPHKMIGSYQM
jgi:hypothetical protein